MDSEMPRDPFREGQVDWGPLASNDAAFLSAHVAAGMSEVCALELTKVYLQFALNVLLASGPHDEAAGQEQAGESPQ